MARGGGAAESVNQITECSQREREEKRSTALIQFGWRAVSAVCMANCTVRLWTARARRGPHFTEELSNVRSISLNVNLLKPSKSFLSTICAH